MEIRVSSSIAERFRHRAQMVAVAREAALDRGAQVLLQAKVRQVQQGTYARPIPKGKNGNPKWPRSGDLLAGQTIEREPGERRIVTTGKAAVYEGRVANLPTGADGVNRSNPAARKAVEVAGKQAVAAFEQEFFNRLERA